MFSILVKAPTNKYLHRKEYQKGHHYYTTEQTASHRGIFTTSRANSGVSSPSTGTSIPPVKSYKQHTMWNLYTTVPPDILISIFINESYNKKGLKIWGTIWCSLTKKKNIFSTYNSTSGAHRAVIQGIHMVGMKLKNTFHCQFADPILLMK